MMIPIHFWIDFDCNGKDDYHNAVDIDIDVDDEYYLLFQCGRVHHSRLQSLVQFTLPHANHFQPAEQPAILSATMMDFSLMVA